MPVVTELVSDRTTLSYACLPQIHEAWDNTALLLPIQYLSLDQVVMPDTGQLLKYVCGANVK